MVVNIASLPSTLTLAVGAGFSLVPGTGCWPRVELAGASALHTKITAIKNFVFIRLVAKFADALCDCWAKFLPVGCISIYKPRTFQSRNEALNLAPDAVPPPIFAGRDIDTADNSCQPLAHLLRVKMLDFRLRMARDMATIRCHAFTVSAILLVGLAFVSPTFAESQQQGDAPSSQQPFSPHASAASQSSSTSP